jgi:hypothetical protein
MTQNNEIKEAKTKKQRIRNIIKKAMKKLGYPDTEKKKLISVVLYISALIISALVVSVYCILTWNNFNEIKSLKKELIYNTHWECEKEYDTDKKIGCDLRCEVSEEVYKTGISFKTINYRTGQMFIYANSGDVATCYELKELNCEITWNYEKACTRYILVRN